MSITLKRDTGWMGTASNLTVKVNGEKVTKIANNQELKLDLPEESAKLKVTQFGARSNELTVHDGDTVEITTTKGSTMIFWGIIIGVFLMNLTESVLLPFLFIIGLAVAFVVYDSYALTVVEGNPAQKGDEQSYEQMD